MTLKDVIGAIILIPPFIWLTRLNTRKQRFFFKHGLPGTAEVTKVLNTGINTGTGSFKSPIISLELQVDNPDGGIRQVLVEQAFNLYDVPQVGDKLHILTDPKDVSSILIVSNFNGNVYRR